MRELGVMYVKFVLSTPGDISTHLNPHPWLITTPPQNLPPHLPPALLPLIKPHHLPIHPRQPLHPSPHPLNTLIINPIPRHSKAHLVTPTISSNSFKYSFFLELDIPEQDRAVKKRIQETVYIWRGLGDRSLYVRRRTRGLYRFFQRADELTVNMEWRTWSG